MRSMAAVLSLAATLCVWAPPAVAARQSAGQESGDPGSPPAYVISPGDILQLFVWKEADLSRDLTVRIDGKVTVPLLGDVTAGGRTPSQLAAEITESLKRFVAVPQVTVGIAQAHSARFYVLGQVARPGDFPLVLRPTVLQGLALAGGFREFAKTDSIVIIRRTAGAEQVIRINYKRLEAGNDLAQNVLLLPGDTILVP